MTRATILTEYRQHERATRSANPGNILLPENVTTAINITAMHLGLDPQDVRDVVMNDAAGMRG